MGKNWSLTIKYQFAILINLIVIPLVILLAFLLYYQFKQVINERILLQLTSIRQLKSVQIEDYLQRQWYDFQDEVSVTPAFVEVKEYPDHYILPGDQQFSLLAKSFIDTLIRAQPGLYDCTLASDEGTIKLAYKVKIEDRFVLSICSGEKIQEILLERTGMGATGETYLVGSDLRLRSASRFLPEVKPIDIRAQTKGTVSANKGESGVGIFNDYRGVPVYSAYGPLGVEGLQWSILSEIDVEEVMQPVERMRKRLVLISLIIIGLLILVTFRLTDQLTRPLRTMQHLLSQMASGRIDIEVPVSKHALEVNSMFGALEKLKGSISEAVQFADELGNLNLEKDYNLISEHDVLGEALIQMRDRLKKFNELEQDHQIEKEKALVQGQEKERSRLARELHDGLGPMLTSLKMIVGQQSFDPDSKNEINNLINETISEVRKMSYSLMPSTLVDFGVGYAVSRLIESLNQVSGLKITFINSLDAEIPLPMEVGLGLYRIIQEALNNTIKYSRASSVHLSLTQFEDHVALYYSDNGSGFDPEQEFEGSGIMNMRERCRILHGDFQILSGENGTQIEVDIPIKNA